MNEPQTTACDKFRLLKQEYESALREGALYEYGGAASTQQAIRYESAVIAVAKMGGISELCKVFTIATVRNVNVMPHCFYDGPGLLAAIHTTAALGSDDAMVEWRYFDLEAQLYGGTLNPADGRISVPQRPGLGIDPDPDFIRHYLRA